MMPWREIVRLTPRELAGKVRRSIGYRLVNAVNCRRRDRFMQVSPDQYLKIFSYHQLTGVHVHSICGAQEFYQQILSILSFLRHTGIPETWAIASDGSLTAAMEKTLKELHPVIQIVPWTNFITDQNRTVVEWYSRKSPMGKKLAVVTGLCATQTSVYVDSDILFFPGASHLRELLKARAK